MINYFRNVEDQIGVRILTCEAEIILSLISGEKSAGELALLSKNSNTSFFLTLRRIQDLGIITSHKSQNDARITMYRLNDSIKSEFAKCLNGLNCCSSILTIDKIEHAPIP